MKPTYSQGRHKTCACKNATPKMNLSDEEGSNSETFINVDASQRFLEYISGISILSECGFVLDKQEDNLGLPGDVVDINNKSAKVVVRKVSVSYSDETINMFFGLNHTEDRYQELLDASDDRDFDVFMDSLCNMGTKWLEYG
ncbi:hypothetical protein RYX36_021577, partial [Vicia faba]